ncbi:site-specific DNA-methyltransferase [Verminephrobacter eiseniae]|uniref:site-specific DNA-methyltransferase n=1 Tax=Verminephrobacter eiseniae TaxID=364317 RepID=UPI002238FE26|nr:DNA methyltransferase [Verminephrobacter eiseniae]MCW5231960.1 site-specific DNA-methyltransferase [Verminephrobacter eiseniae]MCW5296478.1 site-specific DNA-methyltransferase [Verminephrobacter eiseniae]MCW8187276.1 site-specific DNA-methyltransferase [Verminephrobacter eiseniae]MCW8224276.1 site-specific DNA-methyltransferase [Verminephrobacter eiseniae]MCW8235406.1 site-specific DNA-methyltransferase [Verminephrobacter eiseniae]
MATRNPKAPLVIDTLKHEGATRKNIPTAEYQSVMAKDEQSPRPMAYPRANTQWLSDLAALHDLGKSSDAFQQRLNRDLDPQLLWRGKDQQDWSDLVVNAPPLYIQEKVHPKVLIDDLRRETERQREASARGNGQPTEQPDLFADFNGLPSDNARTEFYQHDGHWANRMILGDSLQVMASLAEREGLRGKVQCIYFDPPYGIKFNSNFQWSTTSRDVKDGNAQHITREPEQVKAFRDTWRDGIHSYLTYLRDRLTVARDLLTESGSIFVQIGDENVHRVRAVMDEVFGEENFCAQITMRKTTGKGSGLLDTTVDFILWYARHKDLVKYRPVYEDRRPQEEVNLRFVELAGGYRRSMSRDEFSGATPLPAGSRIYRPNPLTSARVAQGSDVRSFPYQGRIFTPGNGTFKTNHRGLTQLAKADRLIPIGTSLNFLRYFDDFSVKPMGDVWEDTRTGGFGEDRIYVVQTVSKVIGRCLLMTTDPGDLVLDPTCGSGTTAYAAEQWGRRWITIDTSRVALALARARIMGARYPYYLLADSREGQLKEAEVTRSAPSTAPVHGDVRQGFVYERVPHITLKSIANNAEIDVIWEQHQQVLEPLRASLNIALGKIWQEWEIPREADAKWQQEAQHLHAQWWQQRIARQKEIDASIAAKAEFEYLYDKPYPDKNKVRVAGPFTVESLSPHRVLAVGADDELIDPANPHVAERQAEYNAERNFVQIILENLKTAGVQQAHKQDRISFTSLTPWPGELVCAEGRYAEGETEKRAAIFIGPEFGTVARLDLVAAAREAGDAGFDVLIACAFNYDAHSSEFDKLGRIPVLKARMNADLHMADDLKNTGKGNLFVIFGEPDIDILDAGPHGDEGQVRGDGDERIRVRVNGVDVFHPNTGEVRSDGAEGIACWFIDTDYNEESFFVRHAYFLGANDPYKSLKTTLKAEVDADAWATLNSDISRPFDKPKSGRIAVKVINHLGDEVMKVFKI